MIHHGFKKGKRVLLILKSGEKIIDKFVDSNSNIRATTINKNRVPRKGVML